MAELKRFKLNWSEKSSRRFSRLVGLPKLRLSGFTMIELIIGVVVYAIISTVVAVVISNSLRMYSDVRSRKNLNIDGQYSVFLFTRDYSHLSQDTGLLTADNKKLLFKSTQGYMVEYQLDTTSFTRKLISEGIKRTLANNVDVNGSQFQYFEKNHTPLTNFPLSAADRLKVWKVELLINMANETDTIAYLADVYPENNNLAVEGCTGN